MFAAKGELYIWGSGQQLPLLVQFPLEDRVCVVKVALGEGHTALLTGDNFSNC